MMFHYFSIEIDYTELNFSNNLLKKYFENTLSPYFTKEEINRMYKKEDIFLNAEEMLERWIATEIID